GDGFCDVLDAAGDSGVASGAGMNDQVVGAELEGADDLVAEGDDGIFPLARIGRGEIDQVVGVDGDGTEAELGAALAETLGNGSGDGALMRARPEKICSAVQPMRAAVSRARLASPAMEVWMPMRGRPSSHGGAETTADADSGTGGG